MSSRGSSFCVRRLACRRRVQRRVRARVRARRNVVQVLNGVAVAVGLLGQVIVGVVLVGLAERRGERGLGHTAKGVIGERGLVAARVGDAGEPVGVIVGVAGGLAVLVRS
jgi:hypothetical protein